MSKYDAFISYCHGGRDSRVAETLHKQLEHYHVPREVRRHTGKNKIKRVFLDNEELPVSNQLTKEICDALDQTEYLIVICSYRSKESEWVNKEVAYFLEHHDDSRVLPVVIEGQMKDVVPEKILIDKDGNTTDHMYADLSGTSWMDTRKMMRTAKLRILAHLLGVEYPELKRRDLDQGVIVEEYVFDSDIIQLVDWEKNSCLVGTQSGWVKRIRFTRVFTDMTFVALPEESCSCVNASNRNGFIAVQVNGQDIFYKIPADPKLACFEPEDGKDADIQLIDYYHFDDASFMLVEGQDLANDRYFLTLIDMETGEKVHQVALEAGYLLSYMDVYAEEGSIWLSYVEYYNSDQNSQNFHRINVDTGEEYVNTFSSRENYDSPIISSKYRKIICEKEFKVLEMLSWDGNTIAEEKMLNLDSYAYQYALSGDQRYLFLIYEKDDAMVSYVYDLEEDVFLEVEGISQKKDSRYNILIQAADQGPKICVYTDKSLYVVDCSEQKVLSEIGLGKRVSSSELEFSFFDHGQYILISEPEKVQMYDADSGEYRSSVSYSPKKTSKLVGGGSIWTNRSSRWFTVENNKSYLNSSAGTLLDERMLFYVDDELNMHPHAGVVDGFADFEGERIMIPVDNKIYWAGFYDEETLIREAEEILGVDRAGDGTAEGSGLGAEGTTDVGVGQGVDEDAAISQSTDNAAGAGIGQDTKKNTSGSFGKNAADSAVTAEKKAFTDASERTIWEVKENLTSIEAVDQGENYVISLTGKQAKKVENVSANIFWESVEDGRTVYYKALSGRKLEVNDKNQIVFPKNQEIPGLWNGAHSQLMPVLRLKEKLENGARNWSTGSFFVNDIHDLSYVSNLPENLHVSEGTGGKLDYIINSDAESLVAREEETAFIQHGQFVLSNTVGLFAENIRDEKGTVLPAEKWGCDVIAAITASVDFAEQPEFSLEELDDFENAFSAQICIYYSDGTIQTTDILPMKEETSQYCERCVLEEGEGQWTFDIYPEYAELRSYSKDSGKTVIPSEVKGVPVTTIRTGAFLQRYSDGDDVKEWTIIIPESVETIDPTGFHIDEKMRIELAAEKHFVIRDGLLMTADGKRVISGLECGQSELVIPDGVETIDPYAFNAYSKLEKVHFPEGLRTISSYAFYKRSLKEITLPDSLEFIGVHAFGRDVYAWNLKDQNVQECKSVRIGKNVRFIGENAFSGICVREFSVDPQNELYCAMDGVIYTKDKKILVQYPNGKNGVYTVPDGVEVIPQSALAFSGVYRDVVPDSWGITEFRMSDSVKTVKYGNVPYSRRFAKVVLSKNLEDSDSFLGMDLFEVLELSEDSPVVVDEDGNYYNRDKTRLYLCGEKVEEYVFPESVTTFDYGAFDHCPILRKITIPSGLDLDTDSAQSFISILENRDDLLIEEIEVGEGNQDFRVVDGKLMSASGKTVLFEDFRENTNHEELRWE